MIWLAVGMAVAGLLLSAFFSGSETGFYRATRLRLVLDALAGDRVARGLLWLTNHPSIFVATILLGNNLANYLVSLAAVMGTHALLGGPSHLVALLVPLALAPALFVGGELLPKNLFLQAPNRLLRRSGPLILLFVVLFSPLSALLWGLSKVVGWLLGESPQQVRLTFARRELRRVLEEGHEAGILRPAQRALAQGIFTVAELPLARFTAPLAKWPSAADDATKEDILALAQQRRSPVVLIASPPAAAEPRGYVRVIDLGLSSSPGVAPVRPLLEIPATTPYVDALIQVQTAQESLARVVDAGGKTIGIVTADRLRELLFRGGQEAATTAGGETTYDSLAPE